MRLLILGGWVVLSACTASRAQRTAAAACATACAEAPVSPARPAPIDELSQTYQTAFSVCPSDPAFAARMFQQVLEHAERDSDLYARASLRLDAIEAAKGDPVAARRACNQAGRSLRPTELASARAPEDDSAPPSASASPSASAGAGAAAPASTQGDTQSPAQRSAATDQAVVQGGACGATAHSIRGLTSPSPAVGATSGSAVSACAQASSPAHCATCADDQIGGGAPSSPLPGASEAPAEAAWRAALIAGQPSAEGEWATYSRPEAETEWAGYSGPSCASSGPPINSHAAAVDVRPRRARPRYVEAPPGLDLWGALVAALGATPRVYVSVPVPSP